MTDPESIDFFRDEALVEDPYPYFEQLRDRSARSSANRTTAWSW